ncbi:hypothetical protein [Planosporangium mesophilum]|uniref:hypothetical protein n=1 Tax=Planosporangium mesophilum TaxID=689768 RepID=UPI001EF3BD56|nr:hypothetical protein [Planosporangium mesophilum]
MTNVAVSPVIPPIAPAAGSHHPSTPGNVRPSLPLPRLADTRIRTRATVYGLATLDCHGRASDLTVIRALGWAAGTRLNVRERGGLVLVTADRQGVFGLTTQGHLQLPATVRRWCGLATGDRVLLAADPADGLLVVYPPAILDSMITQFHARVLGGDAG